MHVCLSRYVLVSGQKKFTLLVPDSVLNLQPVKRLIILPLVFQSFLIHFKHAISVVHVASIRESTLSSLAILLNVLTTPLVVSLYSNNTYMKIVQTDT